MKQIFFLLMLFPFLLLTPNDNIAQKKNKKEPAEKIAPNIDLSHWKVTIPTCNDKGDI